MEDNQQQITGQFIIPEYQKMNICKINIEPISSFSIAPIMLANSAMNLAAILISLL